VERIKQGLKKAEEELRILHRVAQYLSSKLELKESLTHIVEITTELTKADSCLLYLFDVKTRELVLRASKNPHPEILGRVRLKLGEGLTGWVAQHKTPVVLPKEAYKDRRFKSFTDLPEDRFEAFLSVPILSKDEVIGVINIQHRKRHSHTDSQVKLLSTVARYLGSSIQNAISYAEVDKKTRQVDLLSKISKTIISNTYLKEMLQLIVTMTAQVMNSKICSIMLLDEKKNELVIVATQSLSSDYINKPGIKVGQSISGQAVQEKKPITVPNVTKEPRYMYPELASREGLVSMLSVPMMIKERVTGVINSYTDSLHEFSQDEIDILQAIANQAAVAIEQTRLDQEILKAREELESRKLIERAKGILMQDLGIPEEEAYKKLQRKSMDMRKSMKEMAEALILAAEMKKKLDK